MKISYLICSLLIVLAISHSFSLHPVLLQEQFDIQDFMSKYDLIDSDYSITMGSKWINPNEAIKQFVEDNSVANIRQRRLSELGL